MDHVFERFDKRYFLHEQVLVDDPALAHPGYRQQYGAIVRKVLPPAFIMQREVSNPQSPIWAPVGTGRLGGFEQAGLTAYPPAYPPQPDGGDPSLIRLGEHAFTPVQVDRIAHLSACDLEIPQATAEAADPPTGYVYQVQLMQGNQFTGMILDIDASKMQRDRLMWNKALLRKYLKECLYRESAVGSAWQVKPKWVTEYGIPTQVSEASLKRSADLRDDMLHRRKRVCCV